MRGEECPGKTYSMSSPCFLFFFFSLLALLFHGRTLFVSADTIFPAQSIKDGQNLTSQSGTFELGFFSPSNSKNRYLGIWYKTIPLQTIVWVANGGSPINDSSGVLMISTTGNLVIQNGRNDIVWSTNSSKTAANPVADFLESGNLVLRDRNSAEYLWQSFDYPSDTLLPGMKLGWDLKTGLNRYIRSWKSSDDPSPGDFTYAFDFNGSLDPLLRRGSKTYYRSGMWNGMRYSGSPDLKPNPIFTYNVFHNENEVYYMYQLVKQSVISRLVITQMGNDGKLERSTWVANTQNWVPHVPIPRDRCDAYSLCGPDSICDVTDVPVCQCLKGFKPRTSSDWNDMDWSQGCQRRTVLECDKGTGFMKFTEVKLPDMMRSWMNTSTSIEECRVKCLQNCTCTAYTNADIRNGGSGCVMWFGDLIDIRQWEGAGQDLYIRMANSELGHSRRKKRMVMIISVTLVMVILALLFLGCCYISRKKKGWRTLKTREPNDKGESSNNDVELPLFDLGTISAATNNFSMANKLGEGGFGPVYKGKLEEGQDIAVKRLSKHSLQGMDEFKNEVILISKLQHRNLVKILGCCIEGDERMLIYEYMPNRSLDFFVFDMARSRLLDWQKRYNIILGIARGILYLHHDSRLRIIHRDLKASNILLDSDMEPKISDFGMARIFGGDEIEANTNRVVGTHGYMSPEYAVDGQFSIKSDVFSFGVLVLEILNGKRNRGFYHHDHQLNLLGHAWRLWTENKAIELVDQSMGSSFVTKVVVRCIHIALLCVQQSTQTRPTMSTVILMLSSDDIVLPQPEPPGFYVERSFPNSTASFSDKDSLTFNDASVTMIEGR